MAADALHFALLQDAQQLDLQLRRQLGDFVEEDRAPVRHLETPGARLDGSGERTALMPEQLRLGDPERDRAAVHAHERPATTRAQRVQSLCD